MSLVDEGDGDNNEQSFTHPVSDSYWKLEYSARQRGKRRGIDEGFGFRGQPTKRNGLTHGPTANRRSCAGV